MKDNALVFIKNDTPLTTSRTVAEQFDKQHKHVIRDIETIIEQMASGRQSPKLGSAKLFIKTTYQAEEGGRKYPATAFRCWQWASRARKLCSSS